MRLKIARIIRLFPCRTSWKRVIGISTHPASLWLLAALFWPVAGSAQPDSQNMKACNLLTAAELSAAIGGSVGDATGVFTPKNAKLGRNGDFWSCEETVGRRNVRIFYNTLPVTAEGKKLAQERRDRFVKRGYQLQEKEINGLHCATIVPPGGADALPPPRPLVGTECHHEKGPYHVIVTVEATGTNDLVPMEKVASLAEKAASRVPAQ